MAASFTYTFCTSLYTRGLVFFFVFFDDFNVFRWIYSVRLLRSVIYVAKLNCVAKILLSKEMGNSHINAQREKKERKTSRTMIKKIKIDIDQVYESFVCVLTLKAPIATKVVCFSPLLKCLRSLYGNQCGPRSDCSYGSSLI